MATVRDDLCWPARIVGDALLTYSILSETAGGDMQLFRPARQTFGRAGKLPARSGCCAALRPNCPPQTASAPSDRAAPRQALFQNKPKPKTRKALRLWELSHFVDRNRTGPQGRLPAMADCSTLPTPPCRHHPADTTIPTPTCRRHSATSADWPAARRKAHGTRGTPAEGNCSRAGRSAMDPGRTKDRRLGRCAA